MGSYDLICSTMFDNIKEADNVMSKIYHENKIGD